MNDFDNQYKHDENNFFHFYLQHTSYSLIFKRIHSFLFIAGFRSNMEEPRNVENNDAVICFICDKLGSGSMSSTDLGNIVRISRGMSTPKTASAERQDRLINFLQTEFLYAHTICRQKYMNKKYIEIHKNQEERTSIQSPPEKKNGAVVFQQTSTVEVIV